MKKYFSVMLSSLILAGCGSPAPPIPSQNAPTNQGVEDATQLVIPLVEEPVVVPTRESVATDPPAGKMEPSTSPTEQGIAPVAAEPSPEQLAKWSIPIYEPLQLMACYDGFKDSFVLCSSITSDGKQFVLGGGRLTLWNAAEPQPIIDLLASATGTLERPILCTAISPDDKWLAAGDASGQLRLWTLSDHQEVISLNAHQGRLSQVAFSPNSQQLATTNYSGEVRLWNAADGKPIKSLKLADHELKRLLFVTDTLLATAGENSVLWDIETGKQAAVLSSDRLMGAGLSLSHDGRVLAFADANGIALWDVEKATATGLTLRGHSQSIDVVDISPSGKWIATYAGRTVRIWNAASGQCVQVIDSDGGETTDLKWFPHVDLLMVATESGRVRFWGTPENAKSIGLQPLELPVVDPLSPESQQPASWAQLNQVIDIRSLPRLPGAQTQYQMAYLDS